MGIGTNALMAATEQNDAHTAEALKAPQEAGNQLRSDADAASTPS